MWLWRGLSEPMSRKPLASSPSFSVLSDPSAVVIAVQRPYGVHPPRSSRRYCGLDPKCGVPAPRPIVLLRLLNLALALVSSLSPLFSIPRVGLELLPSSPEVPLTRTRSLRRLSHPLLDSALTFPPHIILPFAHPLPNVGCHAREFRNLARTLLCLPPSRVLIVLRPIPRSVCVDFISALSHCTSSSHPLPACGILRQHHVALCSGLCGGFFPRLGRQMTTVAANREIW
ncbi:hypothetical protein BJY01DRAFT_154390 [Aspergillus pseudoustus]|uniref:Uncharacterized protein n=1 Tax=Aspergillus pseudoustus TaxID=1810923 RepID=A0ABR4K8D5_9EURO